MKLKHLFLFILISFSSSLSQAMVAIKEKPPLESTLMVLPSEIIQMIFEHLKGDDKGLLYLARVHGITTNIAKKIVNAYLSKTKLFPRSSEDIEFILQKNFKTRKDAAYISEIRAGLTNFYNQHLLNALNKNQLKQFRTLIEQLACRKSELWRKFFGPEVTDFTKLYEAKIEINDLHNFKSMLETTNEELAQCLALITPKMSTQEKAYMNMGSFKLILCGIAFVYFQCATIAIRILINRKIAILFACIVSVTIAVYVASIMFYYRVLPESRRNSPTGYPALSVLIQARRLLLTQIISHIDKAIAQKKLPKTKIRFRGPIALATRS